MELDRAIYTINVLSNRGDIKQARNLIDHYIVEFDDYKTYMRLNDNSRSLLKVARESRKATEEILNQANGGNQSEKARALTRQDLLILGEINKASYNYDIPRLRLVLRNSGDVLNLTESQQYLTDTAKSVISSLGVQATVRNNPTRQTNQTNQTHQTNQTRQSPPRDIRPKGLATATRNLRPYNRRTLK